MKINRRLMRIALVSMIIALILTVFTYSTIKRAAQPETTESIAFFKRSLERDTIVKESDLDMRHIPKSLVPAGAVRNKSDVTERRLTIDVTAGDFALEHNFITRGDIRVDVNDMWIISIEIDNIANFLGAQLREGEDYVLVFIDLTGESRLLNKPDKLDNREWNLIKHHAEFGAAIASMAKLDRNIVKNILYHHEDFIGTGYPKKAKANEIPIGAAIIRICDTYDAIRTSRPYKESHDHNTGIREILKYKEKYHPKVLPAFLSLDFNN